MVKFAKIVLGIVAFIILFIAAMGFMLAPSGEKGVPIFLLVIGGFLLLLAFKYKGPSKNSQRPLKVSNSTNKFSFQNADVNRIVMQVLESVDIVSTTKNIDTLTSRLQFLSKVYQELLISYSSKTYKPQALATLDNYKQLYYNKEVSETQMIVVTNPTAFDYNEFAVWSIYNCFVNNFEFQKMEIDKLKTERGKIGRYKKLQENLIQTINLINHDYKCEFSEVYMERLETYKTIIANKLNQ